MRKVVIIPIIVITVIILGFSFVPLLKAGYQYNIQQDQQDRFGDQQTFNDGTIRCLLKDSDGFKCKTGTGVNMDTGNVNELSNSVKRDLERYGKVMQPAGQNTPMTLAELEYLNEIEERRYNPGNIPEEIGNQRFSKQYEFVQQKGASPIEVNRYALQYNIDHMACGMIYSNYLSLQDFLIDYPDASEEQKQTAKQGIIDNKEAFDEHCIFESQLHKDWVYQNENYLEKLVQNKDCDRIEGKIIGLEEAMNNSVYTENKRNAFEYGLNEYKQVSVELCELIS